MKIETINKERLIHDLTNQADLTEKATDFMDDKDLRDDSLKEVALLRNAIEVITTLENDLKRANAVAAFVDRLVTAAEELDERMTRADAKAHDMGRTWEQAEIQDALKDWRESNGS